MCVSHRNGNAVGNARFLIHVYRKSSTTIQLNLNNGCQIDGKNGSGGAAREYWLTAQNLDSDSRSPLQIDANALWAFPLGPCALIVWVSERGNALDIQMPSHRHRVYRARDSRQWEWEKEATDYKLQCSMLNVQLVSKSMCTELPDELRCIFGPSEIKSFHMPEKFTFVLMEKLLLISVSVCEHLRLVQFSSRSLSLSLYIHTSFQTTFRACEGRWKPLRLYL